MHEQVHVSCRWGDDNGIEGAPRRPMIRLKLRTTGSMTVTARDGARRDPAASQPSSGRRGGLELRHYTRCAGPAAPPNRHRSRSGARRDPIGDQPSSGRGGAAPWAQADGAHAKRPQGLAEHGRRAPGLERRVNPERGPVGHAEAHLLSPQGRRVRRGPALAAVGKAAERDVECGSHRSRDRACAGRVRLVDPEPLGGRPLPVSRRYRADQGDRRRVAAQVARGLSRRSIWIATFSPKSATPCATGAGTRRSFRTSSDRQPGRLAMTVARSAGWTYSLRSSRRRRCTIRNM